MFVAASEAENPRGAGESARFIMKSGRDWVAISVAESEIPGGSGSWIAGSALVERAIGSHYPR